MSVLIFKDANLLLNKTFSLENKPVAFLIKTPPMCYRTGRAKVRRQVSLSLLTVSLCEQNRSSWIIMERS